MRSARKTSARRVREVDPALKQHGARIAIAVDGPKKSPLTLERASNFPVALSLNHASRQIDAGDEPDCAAIRVRDLQSVFPTRVVVAVGLNQPQPHDDAYFAVNARCSVWKILGL